VRGSQLQLRLIEECPVSFVIRYPLLVIRYPIHSSLMECLKCSFSKNSGCCHCEPPACRGLRPGGQSEAIRRSRCESAACGRSNPHGGGHGGPPYVGSATVPTFTSFVTTLRIGLLRLCLATANAPRNDITKTFLSLRAKRSNLKTLQIRQELLNFRAIAEAIKRRKSELQCNNYKGEFRLLHIIVDKKP